MKVNVESEYLKSERQGAVLLQLVFIVVEIADVTQISIQLPTREWVEDGVRVNQRKCSIAPQPLATSARCYGNGRDFHCQKRQQAAANRASATFGHGRHGAGTAKEATKSRGCVSRKRGRVRRRQFPRP